MLDTLTPSDFCKALESGDAAMKEAREQRTEAYANLLGPYFPKKNKRRLRQPMSLTTQLRTILEPYLCMPELKAAVRATDAQFDFEAELHRLDLNMLAKELELDEVVADCVIDALMSVFSVARMGLRTSHESIDIDGQTVPLTYPFAVHVDLDDYCCDPDARKDGEMLWEASRNRFLRSLAISSGVFGRDPGETDLPNVMTRAEAVKFLQDLPATNDGSDNGRTKRATGSSSSEKAPKPFEVIEVWDAVLYTDQGPYLVIAPTSTRENSPMSDKWLLAEPYQGAGRSPFLKLRLHRVPGTIYGQSPESMQRDLAEGMDEVVSKAMSRMKKMKAVNAYSRGAEDDAMSLKNAKDEEWKAVDDARAVNRIEQGGVPDQLFKGMGVILSNWNSVTGQLQLVQGEQGAAGGDTATEYQGQSSRASAGVNFKAGRVQKFETKIFNHLGWWSCANPMAQRTVRFELGPGGQAVNIPFSADAGTKKGEYWNFAFDCEAYSQQSQDPAIRTRRILDGLDAMAKYIPLMQFGVRVDQIAILLRRELDAPEFERIIPAAAEGGQVQMARQLAMQTQQAAPTGRPMGVQVGGGVGRSGGAQGDQVRPVDAGRSAMAVGVPA